MKHFAPGPLFGDVATHHYVRARMPQSQGAFENANGHVALMGANHEFKTKTWLRQEKALAQLDLRSESKIG